MTHFLTQKPTSDDTLLFCLPVCAPYSTLQNYKYKVKFTPGTGKKGKSAKQAISIFTNQKDSTELEKNLIKSILDNDLFKNLPGKLKLVHTGQK